MRITTCLFVLSSIAFVATAAAKDGPQPLVVHEWGTFTVLQDDLGNPVDGVNINEESLPGFVHELASELTPDSHELGSLIGIGYFTQQRARVQRSKGIQRYYHAARMRMETPIIYLHPPHGETLKPIDLTVDFKGGWVTEWYPQAKVHAPGYRDYQVNLMSELKPSTTGSIKWTGVSAGQSRDVPKTDSPVWLAPRKTSAPAIRLPDGETENYLFYRGVANLQAPLRVTRDGDQLNIQPNTKSTCQMQDFSNLDMWLVNVDPKGQLEYRRVRGDAEQSKSNGVLATTAASFRQQRGRGLKQLRQEMLAALTGSGLFEDEAQAMLNTWEASYFRTSGLRLFFTLPQSWTDRVLPMQVSGYENVETVRTMIGRIELISDYQRELLDKIASGPVSDRSWFMAWHAQNYPLFKEKMPDLVAGRTTLEDLGLTPPPDYQAYMSLGRFRDALILHEIAHPTQRSATNETVSVNGALIQIRHPETTQHGVDSFTMTVPGDQRVINLGEMKIYDSDGQDITSLATLSQSSNYQGRFPITNLVDGNNDSLSHTNPETNPWIRATFEKPVKIGEVRIWNRADNDGRFMGRFDGAHIEFFSSQRQLASAQVSVKSPSSLRAFAANYGLPLR